MLITKIFVDDSGCKNVFFRQSIKQNMKYVPKKAFRCVFFKNYSSQLYLFVHCEAPASML